MIPVSTILAVSDTLAACRNTVYVEERSVLHDDLSKKMYSWVKERIDVKANPAPVIDLGSGSGVGLELFTADGLECVGITASPEEFDVCEKSGYVMLNWDIHDLSQLTNYASGIWARHVLEHSAMPFVLLRSCHAALKEGGWIYIETPAPGTNSRHEENPNHYSVLNKLSWMQLISRAGFTIFDSVSILWENVLGKEEYYCFLAKK